MPHFYLRVTSASGVRVIISVSKKISKKAVTRNVIKRRVRAVMRGFLKELKPGAYLIVAKAEADKVKGQDLKNELKSLLRL